MDQSGLAEDRQRLYPQPPRHPVEDVIQLARVFSLPYDQGAIRTLFDLPTQLPVVFLRAISCRHELEQEAFDATHPSGEKDIDPVHVAATEQEVFDPIHPRSLNVPGPPAAKNRGFCFAGAHASIGPKDVRKRWIASG